MVNFFYEDKFFSDIQELVEHLEFIEGEVIEDLEDDYGIEVTGSNLEPICSLTAENILDAIADDVEFSEENEDDEYKKLLLALKESFDVEKFNQLVPKLYYESPETFIITKAMLLEAAAEKEEQ